MRYLFIREDQAFVAFSYGKMQETGSYKPGSSAIAQDFARPMTVVADPWPLLKSNAPCVIRSCWPLLLRGDNQRLATLTGGQEDPECGKVQQTGHRPGGWR